MDVIFSARGLAALAAFGAVALAVLALALLWEGSRILLRRRSVEKQLQKLTGHGDVEGRSGARSSILKDDPDAVPGWLAPIAARLPSVNDLQLFLEQARSSWSAGTFILLTAGFGLAGGTLLLLFGFAAWIALAGAVAAALIPYFTVVRQRRKRLDAFEEQFPDVIDLLARSARAGHAFQAGLREVAEEASDPAGEEFRQVFEEQRFGLPLSESLLGLSDRIDLVDLRMFVTSALIQKETGGNLAENMDNLSRLIRDRFRFKRDIKTHTAHGRMTGMVLAGTPFFLAILLLLLAPDFMRPLFTDDIGRLLIGGALFMQLIGFLVIRRMTEIEY